MRWPICLTCCFFNLLAGPLLAGGTPLDADEKAWLQKVEHIITPKERKSFRKQLQTKRERQKFMALFWARRDPDLSDDQNPFKREFLARYDFVMAHFEPKRARSPQTPKGKIFLLLGRPDRIEYRIDPMIAGLNYRNAFLNHRPELWVYGEVGHGYRRNQLKIQFVPVNIFGDYSALTDNITWHFLRTLKYKFVLNPDLETAPLEDIEAVDFQGITEVELTIPPQQAAPAREIPVAAQAKPDTTAAGTIDAPAPSRPPPTTSDLAVPGPLATDSPSPPPAFDPGLGNSMALAGNMGFFRRGPERALVLGRVGFPLKSLDFQFNERQFTAPFELRYSMEDDAGQTVFHEQVFREILVPSKKALEKDSALFSQEFAAVLPAGRYRLKIQLRDARTGKSAYCEEPLDLPGLAPGNADASPLMLMDPNMNPDRAKFQISGEPLGMRLSTVFTRGDRIRPLVEVITPEGGDYSGEMRFLIMQDGKPIREWHPFPEEKTVTASQTVLVHPELLSSVLEPGNYQLRFEWRLAEDSLLLREIPLEIR